MALTLSPRLLAVAQAIPRGARLADVGTDHAYLPTWLVSRGICPRAIATDLRPGPLERAAETVARWAVADRVELRLGPGLAPVRREEVDAVTIAGMGGETILTILAQAPWIAEKVCVVQPMSSAVDLRGGLGSLGLHIAAERVSCEGDTLYISMVLAAGGEGDLTAGERWVGRAECHREDPLWPRYLEQEHRRILRALEGLRRSQKPEDRPVRAELEEAAEWIGRLLEQ